MNIKKPAKSGLFPNLSAKFYVISERRITKNGPLVNCQNYLPTLKNGSESFPREIKQTGQLSPKPQGIFVPG